MADSNIPRAKETDCGLLVIDLQGKFSAVITNWTSMLNASIRLVRFFGLVGGPIVVSEQYPKGLGSTVPEILEIIPEASRVILPKTSFSLFGSDDLKGAIGDAKRPQWIICGIETHVCVQQTVFDLLASGGLATPTF